MQGRQRVSQPAPPAGCACRPSAAARTLSCLALRVVVAASSLLPGRQARCLAAAAQGRARARRRAGEAAAAAGEGARGRARSRCAPSAAGPPPGRAAVGVAAPRPPAAGPPPAGPRPCRAAAALAAAGLVEGRHPPQGRDRQVGRPRGAPGPGRAACPRSEIRGWSELEMHLSLSTAVAAQPASSQISVAAPQHAAHEPPAQLSPGSDRQRPTAADAPCVPRVPTLLGWSSGCPSPPTQPTAGTQPAAWWPSRTGCHTRGSSAPAERRGAGGPAGGTRPTAGRPLDLVLPPTSHAGRPADRPAHTVQGCEHPGAAGHHLAAGGRGGPEHQAGLAPPRVGTTAAGQEPDPDTPLAGATRRWSRT